MNSDININNKFKNMMIIYDKIVAIDYIRIIYKIDKTSDKIKIFDANFVSINKDRYKIIYNKKEYKLKEMLDIKKNNEDKLEIKLKGELVSKHLNEMLFGCNTLFSLPNISKWNKNNKIYKNSLILKNLSFNLILLGGEAVGKTSIIKRFTENVFEEYTPSMD